MSAMLSLALAAAAVGTASAQGFHNDPTPVPPGPTPSPTPAPTPPPVPPVGDDYAFAIAQGETSLYGTGPAIITVFTDTGAQGIETYADAQGSNLATYISETTRPTYPISYPGSGNFAATGTESTVIVPANGVPGTDANALSESEAFSDGASGAYGVAIAESALGDANAEVDLVTVGDGLSVAGGADGEAVGAIAVALGAEDADASASSIAYAAGTVVPAGPRGFSAADADASAVSVAGDAEADAFADADTATADDFGYALANADASAEALEGGFADATAVSDAYLGVDVGVALPGGTTGANAASQATAETPGGFGAAQTRSTAQSTGK